MAEFIFSRNTNASGDYKKPSRDRSSGSARSVESIFGAFVRTQTKNSPIFCSQFEGMLAKQPLLRLVHASVAHGFVLARVGLKLTPHPAPPAQLHRSRLQRQP